MPTGYKRSRGRARSEKLSPLRRRALRNERCKRSDILLRHSFRARTTISSTIYIYIYSYNRKHYYLERVPPLPPHTIVTIRTQLYNNTTRCASVCVCVCTLDINLIIILLIPVPNCDLEKRTTYELTHVDQNFRIEKRWVGFK